MEEGRKTDVAGTFEGCREQRVVLRAGRGTEIDIEDDVSRPTAGQLVGQISKKATGQWPDAKLSEAPGIYVDNDNIAGERAFVCLKPRFPKETVQGISDAGQAQGRRDRERNAHDQSGAHNTPSKVGP
ncbi:MAG: hypothetical protein Tsb0019_00430 [Roseibium sp.]